MNGDTSPSPAAPKSKIGINIAGMYAGELPSDWTILTKKSPIVPQKKIYRVRELKRRTEVLIFKLLNQSGSSRTPRWGSKPESLVRPSGRCIVHLDQKRHVKRGFHRSFGGFALKIGPL